MLCTLAVPGYLKYKTLIKQRRTYEQSVNPPSSSLPFPLTFLLFQRHVVCAAPKRNLDQHTHSMFFRYDISSLELTAVQIEQNIAQKMNVILVVLGQAAGTNYDSADDLTGERIGCISLQYSSIPGILSKISSSPNPKSEMLNSYAQHRNIGSQAVWAEPALFKKPFRARISDVIH